MTFPSVEEALLYAANLADVDPSTIKKVPVSESLALHSWLLNTPNTTDEVRQMLKERVEAQKVFKFVSPNGAKLQIVVCPLRSGFECWIVGKLGLALQL